MNIQTPKELRKQYKHPQIKGLYVIPDFVSTEEMDRFVTNYRENKRMKTSITLPNTTVKYNFFSQSYTNTTLTPPFLELSDKARRICTNLQLHRFSRVKEVPEFNHCVVNEYFSEHRKPSGEGLKYDSSLGTLKWNLCTTEIGPFIASYTFSDEPREIYFIDMQTYTIITVTLEKGSFCVLSGDARYKWHHSVETYDIDHEFTRDIRYITLKYV